MVPLVGAQIGREVSELTPQQVKACSVLGGSASKESVQKMMCQLFGRERLNPHVADAAACAVGGLLRKNA